MQEYSTCKPFDEKRLTEVELAQSETSNLQRLELSYPSISPYIAFESISDGSRKFNISMSSGKLIEAVYDFKERTEAAPFTEVATNANRLLPSRLGCVLGDLRTRTVVHGVALRAQSLCAVGLEIFR